MSASGRLPGDPTQLGEGRYVIERRLGAGAFGVVFAAWDRKSGQSVALKLLHEPSATSRAALEREVALLGAVQHPGVVRVLGLERDDEDVFVVLERVDGVDLVSWVRADVPARRSLAPRGLPAAFGGPPEGGGTQCYAPPTARGVERARAGFARLAAALAAVHAVGVVHGDVRRENVRVAPSGRVVLVDFGLAFSAAAGGEAPEVGVVAVLAPEVLAGGLPTPESDAYAVGALAFEALTGALPFLGSAEEITLLKSSVGAPPVGSLVEGVPADLEAMCGALLHRSPERRRAAMQSLARLAGARANS
ncbi:MAG: serine/threonine protein kinase [Polyangiaceae bacterium]|nr:serine/threonine protein kinase [Polyangiaceae bacterium]